MSLDYTTLNLLRQRQNRLGENLRLEQERIGFDWVGRSLEKL